MLIVRSLRSDRVSFCATSFIVNNLGSKFVEPPVLDMKQVVEDSTTKSPLIFVLSPGVVSIRTAIDRYNHPRPHHKDLNLVPFNHNSNVQFHNVPLPVTLRLVFLRNSFVFFAFTYFKVFGYDIDTSFSFTLHKANYNLICIVFSFENLK